MQSDDKKKNSLGENRRFQKRKSFDRQTKSVSRNQSKSPVKQIKSDPKSAELTFENDEEDGFLGDAHIKVVIKGKEAENDKKLSLECDDNISLGSNLSSEESYQ